MKRRRQPHKTRRIYYGPEGREKSLYWTVGVSDARWPVTLNGDVFHALKGYSGVTIGCGLSNMAIDRKNAKAFPHPVYLASFTKTTAFLVDRLKKNGQPDHAVIYRHRYGYITDRNDDNTLKQMVKDDPSIMERSFILKPPSKRPPSGATAGQTKDEDKGKSNRGQAFVPRGALARAVKAGRIGKHAAEQLAEVLQTIET